MTNDQIKHAVLQIIAVIAPDEDLSHVKSDVALRDQLELDSMDFLDIVMELRKRYGVEVPEGDYIVHVEINAAHTFPEGANRYPNEVEAAIHVPDPRNKVTVDNSPAATD